MLHIEVKNIYQYLGTNVADGFREGKLLHSREDKYRIEDCKRDYGLLTDKVWYESFEGLDNFYRKLYKHEG